VLFLEKETPCLKARACVFFGQETIFRALRLSRVLALCLFIGRNTETNAIHLAIAAPSSKFHLQENVAVLVDFPNSVIKRPLFDGSPTLKRRFLHQLP
jgi:hypothetical protein